MGTGKPGKFDIKAATKLGVGIAATAKAEKAKKAALVLPAGASAEVS